MFLNQKHHLNLYGATCTNCKKELTAEEEMLNLCVCNNCLRETKLPISVFVNEK